MPVPPRMIEPRDLVRAVVMPALASCAAIEATPQLQDPRAVLLLTAIAIQESDLRHVRQYPSGPARSWWQIELRTAAAIVAKTRPRFARSLALHNLLVEPLEPVLVSSPIGASVLARMLLWLDPLRLPDMHNESEALVTYMQVWRPAWAIGARPEQGERARWSRAYAEAVTAIEGAI